MEIIFIAHPIFLNSQSMPRFANILYEGMKGRQHNVKLLAAKPFFFQLVKNKGFRKWFGYIDHYLIFPFILKSKLNKADKNTLIVFCDQALGPLIPYAKDLPHVVHVHDFLALESSEGKHPENKVKLSGKLYQYLIKRGFSKAKNFISVSKSTKDNIDNLLSLDQNHSFCIYNGLNPLYKKKDFKEAIDTLRKIDNVNSFEDGYILHVGGNQWYKNRLGVLEIYSEYFKIQKEKSLPLFLVGPKANKTILDYISAITIDNPGIIDKIVLLNGLSDEQLCAVYSLASIFLFPSLEEGFGWPIIEAMACGCPVITTNQNPMLEVGADSAFYIPRRASSDPDWAQNAAFYLSHILSQKDELKNKIEKGFINIKRFDISLTIKKYEDVYSKILSEFGKTS